MNSQSLGRFSWCNGDKREHATAIFPQLFWVGRWEAFSEGIVLPFFCWYVKPLICAPVSNQTLKIEPFYSYFTLWQVHGGYMLTRAGTRDTAFYLLRGISAWLTTYRQTASDLPFRCLDKTYVCFFTTSTRNSPFVSVNLGLLLTLKKLFTI